MICPKILNELFARSFLWTKRMPTGRGTSGQGVKNEKVIGLFVGILI